MDTTRIPRVVWLLGLVSLCMDLSSEMIHSLLPVFLVSTLGASTVLLGLIEGVAEGTASIAKIFSGVLSDRSGRRKPLVVFGYGLAAFSKPLFPLAQSAGWVFVARFADRIGKGIRGAPRDALLSDATPAGIRGAAFGLRQSLDTVGALLGPLVAIVLMSALNGNVRTVFWLATIPAVAAVLLLSALREPTQSAVPRERSKLPSWRDVRGLDPAFWMVVAIGTLVTLARFSEAFLIVRAYDMGLSMNWTPLALATLNITYVVFAYPVGRLSDRIGRTGLLMVGLVILIAADVVLIASTSLAGVLAGIALWGIHLGASQGLLSALVADTAPADLRGSAFGVFHFVTGVGAVAASLLAGVLWKFPGPAYTFGAGGAFAVLALAALSWRWPKLYSSRSARGNSSRVAR
jgi:MFS family permease